MIHEYDPKYSKGTLNGKAHLIKEIFPRIMMGGIQSINGLSQLQQSKCHS